MKLLVQTVVISDATTNHYRANTTWKNYQEQLTKSLECKDVKTTGNNAYQKVFQ